MVCTRSANPLAAILACFILSMFGGARAKKLSEIGITTVDEVNTEIAEELAGHIPAQRIAGLEAVLGSVFKTLPKNAGGRVGHQAVRYALHRLFVKRHGWYIKGLEPTQSGSSVPDAAWIPSYLQDKLEEHLGKNGMDLHELASLGAALEDLIRNEAGKRLKDVYEVLQMSTTEPVSMTSASDALDTYAMAYLLSGKPKNITIEGPRDTERKRRIFAAKYKNYTEFHSWFQVLEQSHFNLYTKEQVSWSTMTRAAEDFGERYGTFNDGECRALKTAMLAVEGKGRGVGRVRLADFYNMSRYSHWKLNEKVEYLRDLGALDESNASNLMVIVPNYITSRPNCLEATPLYAVCCRDECEDLIGRLERDLKEPKALAAKISDLIASYSSDTVQGPRTLSDSLTRHLESIASLHGGEIDVHSRLFAQWMHHAFPRECPYPHETGTTNPTTADEWMKINGHESEQATDEDVQKVLDGACKADMGEEGELPWNPAEELLDGQALPQPTNALLAICLITAGLWGLLIVWHTSSQKGSAKQGSKIKAAGVVSVSLLLAGTIVVDLVDKVLVAAVVFIGLGMNAARHYMALPDKTLQKCAQFEDKQLV